MTAYRIVADPRADEDVKGAFDWYEQERSGLGDEFLDELKATYVRIVDGPLRYRVLRAAVRHCMLHRFPYADYFVVNGDDVSVFAVLHSSRSPSVWQRRLP